MSVEDVKPISSATGTFPALEPRPGNEPYGGKTLPAAGKDVPVPQDGADLEALAAQLNIASQTIGRDLRFKVDMAKGSAVIQVLDRDTGEIIREIPPEKAAISFSGNGDLEIRLFDRRV